MGIKRAIDIAVSLSLLAMLSPVLVAAAIAVRATSPGRAVLAQERWGRDERLFACLKFRSMFVDQVERLSRAGLAERHNVDGKLLKLVNDPRITPVGSFLRTTSIDELPQLLNVLVGDMSLVGPRPLVRHMMEPFAVLRAERCVMRPGITGLWQVRHRENNTSVLDMIDDDREYIRTFSLLLDLRILIDTVPIVLGRRGAH